ncbi:MAG: tetratricopeptide repeat protein [Acidobacteriota bacterium]|nr:MAG: tetratricopeptide repeat protein [Acidobacteriota bacterium]UCF81457.1 MAG: tetratricopeptide repeat protein [Acidobacteriota bacterium]
MPKDEEKILESLRARWKQDPTSRVFAQLAESCRRTGKLEEAVEVCRDGLKHHPQYASAHVTLGRALLGLEKRDEAGKALEQALTLSPANLVANRALGDLYREQGKFGLALERYRMVKELNPLDRDIEALAAQCEVRLTGAEETAQEATTDEQAQTAASETPPEGEVAAAEVSAESLPQEEFRAGAPSAAPEMSFDELYDTEVDEALEAGAPPPSAPSTADTGKLEGEELATETLAELYVGQGLLDKAAGIYERLLREDPANPRYRARLDALLKERESEEPPAPEPVALERNFGEQEKLLADISVLHDPDRSQKAAALRRWLSVVEREKKMA